MAYPASKLISRAWNLSGIVARNLQMVTGGQANDGLDLLNDLLDIKSANTNLIPYWSRYSGNFVVGQEAYDITNLLAIETMTFTMDNTVRYPMTYASREKYFGTGRVNSINSIPFMYHYERQLGGSRVYVYYLPDQTYLYEISGKFGLSDVTLSTDLSTVYDGFYLTYLRYALAEYMNMEYDLEFAPTKKAYLNKLENQLLQVSPPDLTLKKTNFINDRTSLNWAQINIGKGWTP